MNSKLEQEKKTNSSVYEDLGHNMSYLIRFCLLLSRSVSYLSYCDFEKSAEEPIQQNLRYLSFEFMM